VAVVLVLKTAAAELAVAEAILDPVATVTQVAHLVIKEAITVRTVEMPAVTKAEQVVAAVVIEAAQLEIIPTKTGVVVVVAVVAVAPPLL
jgi:hypothetical protein